MTVRKISSNTIRGQRLLLLMAVFTLPIWGVFLVFTRFVPPQSLLAFLVFFCLLGSALLCTLAPVIYLTTRRWVARFYQPAVRHALRQAGLIDGWIIFNLILRGMHSWNVFTAVVSFCIIVVLELLALSRK